jgi:hypothetical protein
MSCLGFNAELSNCNSKINASNMLKRQRKCKRKVRKKIAFFSINIDVP